MHLVDLKIATDWWLGEKRKKSPDVICSCPVTRSSLNWHVTWSYAVWRSKLLNKALKIFKWPGTKANVVFFKKTKNYCPRVHAKLTEWNHLSGVFPEKSLTRPLCLECDRNLQLMSQPWSHWLFTSLCSASFVLVSLYLPSIVTKVPNTLNARLSWSFFPPRTNLWTTTCSFQTYTSSKEGCALFHSVAWSRCWQCPS